MWLLSCQCLLLRTIVLSTSRPEMTAISHLTCFHHSEGLKPRTGGKESSKLLSLAHGLLSFSPLLHCYDGRKSFRMPKGERAQGRRKGKKRSAVRETIPGDPEKNLGIFVQGHLFSLPGSACWGTEAGWHAGETIFFAVLILSLATNYRVFTKSYVLYMQTKPLPRCY